MTGGAGFIASHIVNAYIEAGHRVAVVDDLSFGKREFLDPKATFYQMDIWDDQIAEILEKENIEVINHHAAQVSVQASVKDPVADANANIISTLQLIQKAVESGVKKFIFASTGGAIYGEQEYFPADEDHPCKPESPYAISKLSVEHYLRFYEANSGLKPVIFRYSNIFGPRQNPHGEAGVVAIFCNLLVQGKQPIINGDGEQTRDFLYVMDLVPANLIALAPECVGTFNLGTGVESSVNTLTEILVKRSGHNLSAQHGPGKPGEQKRSVIDYKKFGAEFGWEPVVPLKEGLIKTFDYFANENY